MVLKHSAEPAPVSGREADQSGMKKRRAGFSWEVKVDVVGNGWENNGQEGVKQAGTKWE
jgi:hypothetical protein